MEILIKEMAVTKIVKLRIIEYAKQMKTC